MKQKRHLKLLLSTIYFLGVLQYPIAQKVIAEEQVIQGTIISSEDTSSHDEEVVRGTVIEDGEEAHGSIINGSEEEKNSGTIVDPYSMPDAEEEIPKSTEEPVIIPSQPKTMPVPLKEKEDIKKLEETMITSGAKRVKYLWQGTRKINKVKAQVNVIEVDLANPYVRLDVMTGKGGMFTTKQTVVNMAKETNAVAGINGDFYATKGQLAPIGPQVANGQLMSTPSKIAGMNAFGITKDRTPIIDELLFEGTVTTADGDSYPLEGMNKAAYFTDPGKKYSHVDAMYIYTSAWKSLDRPSQSNTAPTEVLVQNDRIQTISLSKRIESAVPEGGYILRAHGKAAKFIAEHMKEGDTLTLDTNLRSKLSQKRYESDGFEVLIGGGTLLVDQGGIPSFTRKVSSVSGASARARTALGYSADGTKAFVVTVEKNAESSGMDLIELQKFLISIGCYKALNLDGGGSTTLAVRPLGEMVSELAFRTEDGMYQRPVVNGLGVYTSAPAGTKIEGFKIAGDQYLFVGQEASYSLKGYDEYYNPMNLSHVSPVWSSKDGILDATSKGFKANESGKAEITASKDGKSVNKEVTVLRDDQLSQISFGVDSGPLQVGAKIPVTAQATLNNGMKLTVPFSSLKWEFIGVKGSSNEETLLINKVDPNTKLGYAIGRYQDLSVPIFLDPTQENLWETFDSGPVPRFVSKPAGVTGETAIESNYANRENNRVLRLSYDFSANTVEKGYAYAEWNNGSGKQVPGVPRSMALDVYGDESHNWLRAEFIDANKKSHLVDLAKQIDWADWKRVEVDLSGYAMKGPVKLKRVYVVHLGEEESDVDRAPMGEVAFHQITFNSSGAKVEKTAEFKNQYQYTLEKKKFKVNGQSKSLSVAPIAKGNFVYIPVESLLGDLSPLASWDKSHKRLTLIVDYQVIDLKVGENTWVKNGKRYKSSYAPLLENGMIATKFLRENLKVKTDWNEKTKCLTVN